MILAKEKKGQFHMIGVNKWRPDGRATWLEELQSIRFQEDKKKKSHATVCKNVRNLLKHQCWNLNKLVFSFQVDWIIFLAKWRAGKKG